MAERRPITELGVLYRTLTVERDAVGEDGLIPVSLSSEEPVDRWFGREILDHGAASVDMGRAARGLALLDNHNPDRQIGRLVNLRLDNGVLRGAMKFSKSAAAQEIRQDVLDGIRGDTSIGYRVMEMVMEASDPSGETYRVTRWMPLEGSLVAVPADATVGAGRAAEGAAFPVVVKAPTPTPAAPAPEEKRTMTAPAAAAPAAPEVSPTVTGGVPQERERAAEITALALAHGCADRLTGWLGSDVSPDAVRKMILAEKAATPAVAPSGTAASIGAEREVKHYSVVRAINAAIRIAEGGRVDNCPEFEMSRELEKKIGRPTAGPGFYFPMDAPHPARATRTGLDAGTTNAAKEVVFTEPGSFIELLRNSTKVLSLGATFLPGLQGKVSFPRQKSAGTFSWVAENPGADVSDTNLQTDSVTISPHIGQSTTSYSRNLLQQAVIDVEALVRNDLALISAIAIDLAAINGSGASNQPTGILPTSGIGSVAVGTNGGTVTWNNIVDLEKTVDNANALRGALAYLTNPTQKGQLKKIAQISATTGIPTWFDGELNGYRAESSTNVPSNLTKGTSTTICSAIIFGNWQELIVGQWNALELIVDPYRLKKQGMIEVTSYISVDVALRHPASFAAIQDAL